MAARSYLVGLPVAVEITDEGRVTLWVDDTEVSVAIAEECPEEYTDEENAADVATVDQAFERQEIVAHVMRSYWSDGDIVGNADIIYRRQDGVWVPIWSTGVYSAPYPDADISGSVMEEELSILFRKNAPSE